MHLLQSAEYILHSSKNKKESLMSGIFFHASMPHYDLDKGVVGASYGGGHQSIIIQDSCLDRESENQKKKLNSKS